MEGVGKDITHLAFALISVATIALLVSHSKETVEVVKGVGGTFGGLLQIVTLQNQYGNAFAV